MMRHSLMFPPPIFMTQGGATQALYTADNDDSNFGLGAIIGLSSGSSADAFTASPVSVGTLEAEVDLVEVFVSGNGRPGRVALFNGSASTPFAIGAFKDGNGTPVRFLMPVSQGTDLRVGIATNSGGQLFNVAATALQSNPRSTGTGVVAVGSGTASATQGITIPALEAGWRQVGPLAADAIGINQIHCNTGGDTSRPTAGVQIFDIGIGPVGSSGPDRILRRMFGTNGSNALLVREAGPHLHSGMNAGRIIWARTALTDGTNPDATNVQVFVINGPAL